MRQKILNHVEKQSTMTEVVKNTTNPGMRMAVYLKSTNCEAVDWSVTAHVQKPSDLRRDGSISAPPCGDFCLYAT